MNVTAKPRILVIGGYGVFGGKLSRRLVRHQDVEVVVAGRNLRAAEAHCHEYGGIPAQIDTSGDLEAILRAWHPTVIVDAAGPFQLYEGAAYRVARAALAVGAHYIDLADDADFVEGIAKLDSDAKSRGLVALSGCSSVPAISAAAVKALSNNLVTIDSIESVIMPGNRAPRGLSVIKAILSQVGKPMRVWRGGEWATVYGWSDVTRVRPDIPDREKMAARPTSSIGAPDLILLPEHFNARTVRFRAGLELGVMHYGLTAIAWLVRLRLLPSAGSLSAPLLQIANLLKPFGSDRGAMTVNVLGRTHNGKARHHRWTLIAEAGDGPEIPATPAYILALQLCRHSERISSGARACLADLSLQNIEAGLEPFAIATHQAQYPIQTVFEAALGHDLDELPAPIRDLHDVLDIRAFAGRSKIERGTGLLSRIIGFCMRFPPAAEDVSVRVDMKRTASGETWQRHFGKATFRSHLSRRDGAAKGEIWERFGPLSVRINLTRDGDDLKFPVDAVWLFGLLPLPRFLVPTSDTREYIDDEGNACFDVKIAHPMAGFIVRYNGWLQPADESTGSVDV